jgi:hypothetical protein
MELTYFRPEVITQELKKLQEEHFWGDVTLMFQDGKITLLKKTETRKPSE